MLGSFKKSFKNKKDFQPPQDVISSIEKEIPSNFMLKFDEKKGFILVPKMSGELNGTLSFTEEAMEELKRVPRDKWLIYLYRTQKVIDIKGVSIGDADNQIPVELVGNNPLHDNRLESVKMYPQPFDEPMVFCCDTKEGDHIELQMKQVTYDSWEESKFENIDHKEIKMSIYINDDDEKKSRITYSIFPQKAKSTKEAVAIVHLFNGLLDGTALINGHLSVTEDMSDNVDKDKLRDSSDFWENLLKIEKKLSVQFDPGADFSEEDVKLFAELVECFINRKSISWKHPFESFHVNGISSKEQLEECVGKKGLKYTFLESEIPCSMLGVEFKLYSFSELKDFNIVNIKWDSDGTGAEIFLGDSDEKEWTMNRFYLTCEEKHKIENMIIQKRSISIPKDLDSE